MTDLYYFPKSKFFKISYIFQNSFKICNLHFQKCKKKNVILKVLNLPYIKISKWPLRKPMQSTSKKEREKKINKKTEQLKN